VFGVDLEFLLQRESGSHDVQPGAIPTVIERCLFEIESRGLKEVGICMRNFQSIIYFKLTISRSQIGLLVQAQKSTYLRMALTEVRNSISYYTYTVYNGLFT
jgi:hypothetical protein